MFEFVFFVVLFLVVVGLCGIGFAVMYNRSRERKEA